MTTATENQQGHAAHTQASELQGLPGRFHRPVKVTMLGAGSHFTHPLMNDILAIEGTAGGEVALVDIDERRLKPMAEIVQRMLAHYGKDAHWTVTATTDRAEALPGTDYLINSIDVAGVECVRHDNDIPLKYGVDQCIGDTIGPGGLFKALRTAPVFLEILRDARRFCPHAIVLNYTNPMNILCLAAGRAVPQIPVIGLCHSVQLTGKKLAREAELPYTELRWQCAGINHLAWFTRLEHEGRDLYQTVLYDKFRREVEAGLREAEEGKARHDSADTRSRADIETQYEQEDLIRKDMCLQFGAFITESSGHLSEYLPYYRKSDEGRKLLRLGYHGGSSFYADNWPTWRANEDARSQAILSGERPLTRQRTHEYAAWIIEAREKNVPHIVHGNVMNHDGSGRGELISNLPADGCVEVACLIDANGIQPTRYGALPPQMANLCRTNMSMFDLAATACIEKSKEAAIHALMLDPLTAAVCTPRQIRQMAEEMFEAERDWLEGFS